MGVPFALVGSEARRSAFDSLDNVWYIISNRTTGEDVSREDGPRIERSGIGGVRLYALQW